MFKQQYNGIELIFLLSKIVNTKEMLYLRNFKWLLLMTSMFGSELLLANSKINVRSYGAKGDGITDDYEAIKKAIEKFDIIIIPKGTYIISKKFLFTGANNKTIIAIGAVIKNLDNSVGTLEFDRSKNILINGGTWTRVSMPQKEGSSGNEHTFTFVGITNLKITHVIIDGSPQMGIAMIGVINGAINNNSVRNCYRDGIYSHYSAVLSYIDNTIENVKDDALSIHDYGIVSQKPEIIKAGYTQAGHCKILNNVINNCYQGISSIGCADLYISRNKITNTVGAGIAVFNSQNLFKGSTAFAKNIIIERNTLINNCSTINIMGVKYQNGGQLSTGRSALFVAALDNSDFINEPKSNLKNIVVIGNAVNNGYVNGAYLAQIDRLTLKHNSFTNCNGGGSKFTGRIVEIKRCTQVAILNNKVIDNRKKPMHDAGYEITDVTGEMGKWVVKGYGDPNEKHLYGLQPKLIN